MEAEKILDAWEATGLSFCLGWSSAGLPLGWGPGGEVGGELEALISWMHGFGPMVDIHKEETLKN